MDNKINNSEILIQIKKEINELENQIKNVDRNRRKVKLLRFIQYILQTGRLIAPYIVASGIALGTFTFFGKTPFYRDSNKKYLEKMKEIDSLGNIRYEQQYDSYSNCFSVVNYYSEWKLMNDGFYFRTIEQYSAKDIEEKLISSLLSDNDNLSLQDILGKPISKKTELKNNLTEEELKRKSFVQYITYSKDGHNYILEEESIVDNIGWTICYLTLLIFSEFLIFSYRKIHSKFDYEQILLDIKEKYPYVNVEVLKKKIKIKKKNYERLTGDNYE